MKFPDVWTSTPMSGLIVSLYTGRGVDQWTPIPVGTHLSWAMKSRPDGHHDVQLWASDRHGWPVLVMATARSGGFPAYMLDNITTDDPRQLHYPPKGVLP